MKNNNLKIVLLILFSMTLGCRMLMKQAQTKFFDQDAAQKAAQAVKSKVGFPFKVQEVEITPETFKMKIEAPGDTRNIDEYTYLGFVVAGPQPVQRDAMTNSREKMPFDEIDFTVVPQIVKNALDKTQIEGGAVKRITLGAQDGRKFRWWVEIQGTRETASAWADLTGNITSTDLSQTSRAADYKVLNETELNKAVAAFRTKFGDDAQIAGIRIDEKSIGFKVINRENPKNIDSYNFGIDGLKKSTLPTFSANFIEKAFSFKDVNLLDAINLLQKTKERLEMPDGQLSYITLENLPSIVLVTKSINSIPYKVGETTSQIAWSVNIKRGTTTGFVNYDTKLNELSVKKD